MRCVSPRSTMLPLGAGDDARQQVVGKDALGAFVVAVDREGDALVQEGAVGGLLAVPPLGRRQLEQAVEQEAIGVPRRVAGGEHLVEGGVELVVGEQRCRRLRGRGPQHVLVGLRAPRRVNSDDAPQADKNVDTGTRSATKVTKLKLQAEVVRLERRGWPPGGRPSTAR